MRSAIIFAELLLLAKLTAAVRLHVSCPIRVTIISSNRYVPIGIVCAMAIFMAVSFTKPRDNVQGGPKNWTFLQRRRQWGTRGACPPLIKSAPPPPARGLARHNKRFTIEEIIQTVATRCQILRLKCTKSFVGGALPQTPLGELTAFSQTP